MTPSRPPNLRVLLVFSFLAACTFDEGGVASNRDGGQTLADADPSAADAATAADADPNAPDALAGDDASACAGDALILTPSNISDKCEIPGPTGSLVLSAGDWTLNTDARTIDRTDDIGGSPQPLDQATKIVSQASGPDILVIAVQNFTMSSGVFTTELEIVGSRPLMIVAFGTVSIDGEIRVGARGANGGPGADHGSACSAGFGAAGVVQVASGGSGGSGGGGGAFGNNGAGGAKVDDSDGGLPDLAAAGGAVNGMTSIEPLRGGCRGGAGANSGGQGGGGGGAMQITANGAIIVQGYIGAPGAGGRGVSDSNAGGGGGGSGGALLLESGTSITISGALTANGGGGGEGTRGGGAFNGEDGNGGSYPDETPADGGSSFSLGGDGGHGGALGDTAEDGTVGQSSGSSLAGGGGGGGSIGRIHLSSPSTSTPGTISPAAQ